MSPPRLTALARWASVLDFANEPHRRWNPLLQEWVLVSPQRTQRPWQGQVEQARREQGRPAYDPQCYLCPGNMRAAGKRNPDYKSTFVFDNDFPALLPQTPARESSHSDLLIARTERGICRVICFSPRHDLTLSGMSTGDIRKVVDVWTEQYQRTRSARLGKPCANLREPWGHDGREQSAPALPIMGESDGAEHPLHRAEEPCAISRCTWRMHVVRLRRGRRADTRPRGRA